jgi:TonB family protein
MIPTNGMVVRWVVCILMLLPPLAVGKDKKQEEGEALLAKARELSDIRCQGCPPFRLRMRTHVWNQEGVEHEGLYQAAWIGRQQWREEISFPNFAEVRIGGEGKVWISRSLPFLSEEMFRLREVLDFHRQLSIPAGTDLKGPRVVIRKGTRMKCVQAHVKLRGRFEFCFDSDSGALVSQHVGGLVYQYQDYVSRDGRAYPRTILGSVDGRHVVEAHVEALEDQPVVEQSMFMPPADAQARPGCIHPEPAVELEKGPPVYPHDARMRGIIGTVVVYVLVGSDGRAAGQYVVRSAGMDFDNATREAIAGWRWKPSTCEGVPVPEETLIRIEYRLSP